MAKAGSWNNWAQEEGKDDGWIPVHFGKGDILNSCHSSDLGIQSVILQELEELTLQVLSHKNSTSLPAPRCIHSPLHVTNPPQTTSLLKVQLAGLIGGATLTDILQKDLPLADTHWLKSCKSSSFL